MIITIVTKFNKGDIVVNDDYGTGTITAISVQLVLLPDETDEEIYYFVRFTDKEELVSENTLRPGN